MINHKQERAQKIWNTYVNGYSKLLCTPVEQFKETSEFAKRHMKKND